jgi:transketolase
MPIIDSKSGLEARLGASQIAQKAREGRANALIAIAFAKSGHPGGSLSIMDVAAALYYGVLRHDPSNPQWGGRDRLFWSGQHKCPAQYALLGMAGYYPLEDFLVGLRLLGSPFQGHPDWKKCKGIEMSGGSLGQGLSVAVGDALALRLDGSASRVYCIMGDGEQQEGSVWEAAMAAGNYKLDNLCAVIDCNGLQIDGCVKDVMDIEPLGDKYRAFGWEVIDVDGHDINEILVAFEKAKTVRGKPVAILARTVKGKGVPFMENAAGWHGKAESMEQLQVALKDLGCEAMLTPSLLAKAKSARDDVAKKFGDQIPKEQRPFWWNSQPLMKADMAATRKGFGACLERIGSDERIVALGADISDSITILDFCKEHPERKSRFFSMGIAEANMTTAAAGLAKEGKIPVIGSYGVFVTGRNWDQLRTTVCYGDLNVKICVGHGGISVGPDGATHQALEDITLLAVLPNMKVMVPADAVEAEKATETMVLKTAGPCATRFAREATPVVTKPETPFVFGKANVIRFRKESGKFIDAFETKLAQEYSSEGESATVIACGPMLAEAMRAAYILKKTKGTEVRVINLHTIKPIDGDAIINAAKETGNIVTVEEHQAGGVGNLVAGVVLRNKCCAKMRMIGVQDSFGETGQPWELTWKFGLAAEQIASAVEEMVGN